jgi:hypothetical protein
MPHAAALDQGSRCDMCADHVRERRHDLRDLTRARSFLP